MEGDIFGSVVLFEEFEKDRTSSDSFLAQDKSENSAKNTAKHIIFSVSNSDSSDDDVESENEGDQEVEELDIEKEFSNRAENSKHDRFLTDNGELSDNESANNDAAGESKTSVKTPTNYQIIHERNKFRQFSSLIDSTRHVPDEESPAVQVIFQNNDFARKYRMHIEQFLASLVEHEAKKKYPKKPDFPIKSSTMTCVDLNNKLPAYLRNDRMWKAHAIVGNAQFHNCFLVDTLGWPLVNLDPGLTEGWYAPVYQSIFSDILPTDEEKLGPAKKNQRPKASCFNCGGEHMIAECPEPRDMRRINENRRSFQSQRSGSTRYHLDKQSKDSPFSKFQPGKMSEELHHALGISRREIPIYIYRMRELGYPPGWLMDAEKEISGIALFDKDGKEVLLEGDKTEEGEVKEPIPFEGQVNLDKIIEYPGFTVQLPGDVVDDWKKLGMPRLQEHQLKSTLMSHMEVQTESMKRKAEIEEEVELKKLRSLNKEEDMELDDENPDALNQSTSSDFVSPLPTKPVDSSPAATPTRRMLVEGGEDLSLQDLEDQYKVIKQKLSEGENGQVCLTIVDDVQEADNNNLNSSPVQNLSREDSMSSIKSFDNLGNGSPEPSRHQSPGSTPMSFYSDINSSFKGTISIDKAYGTPIVQRKDSFQVLPETSNFTVGITDHIPFENLPDSTGSFLRMKDLIDRIRTKVSGQKKSKKK